MGACIPELIRRRYTNQCSAKSHCLLNEVCMNGKCIDDKNIVLPCEFQRHCKATGSKCINGYCSKSRVCIENRNCNENEICHKLKCVNPPSCVQDEDCTDEKKCRSGTCVDSLSKCTVLADCKGNEVCSAGKCKRKCDHVRQCLQEQDCVNRICESIQEIILMKICENSSNCFGGELCKNQRCVPEKRNNSKVLPKTFLCPCAGNENCRCMNQPMKNQKKKPILRQRNRSSSQSKHIAQPPKVTPTENIKTIIKEILREETKSLVFEIEHRMKTTEENFRVFKPKREKYKKEGAFGYEAGRFLSGPVNIGANKDMPLDEEDARNNLKKNETGRDEGVNKRRLREGAVKNYDQLLDLEQMGSIETGVFRKEDEQSMNQTNEDCIDTSHCPGCKTCILGVCINTTNCPARDSAHKREVDVIYELNDIGKNCSNNKNCGNDSYCHLGFCKTIPMIQSDEEKVECTTQLDCGDLACLSNVCVKVLDITESSIRICDEFCKECMFNICIDE